MKKFVLLKLCILLLTVTNYAKQSTQNVFTNYQLINNPFNPNIQSGDNISLNLGTHGIYNINLTEQNFFSDAYNRTNASTHYNGSISNLPNAKVSLTINDNFAMGFIQLNNEKIFIEPASLYEDYDQSNELIAYRKSDVIANEASVTQQMLSDNQNRLSENNEFNNAKAGCNTNRLEIAMAADNSLFLAFGMQYALLANYLESLNNMSQPYFDNEFANDIILLLVETSIETYPNQFNLSGTLDARWILFDLMEQQSNIWDDTYFDIGIYWTAIDINVQGNSNFRSYSRLRSICKNTSFSVHETYSASTDDLVKLNVHQIGRVLGAEYDTGNTFHIMSPGAQGNTWSTNSINSINNTLDSRSCQCALGPHEDLELYCPPIDEYSIGDQDYISFGAHILNLGNYASDATTYTGYISKDEILSYDDKVFFNTSIPAISAYGAGINPYQHINITQKTLDLPNGTYHLIFHLDPSENDPNLNNNTISCKTIVVDNPPQLYISNVYTVGNIFKPGNIVTLNWYDNIPDNENVSIYLIRESNNYIQQLTYSEKADGQSIVYLPNYYNAGHNYRFEIRYYQGNTVIARAQSHKFSILPEYNLYDLNLSSNSMLAGQQFNIDYTDNIPDYDRLYAYLYRDNVYYVAHINNYITATGSATLTLPTGINNGNNYNILLLYYKNGQYLAQATSPSFSISGSLKVSAPEQVDILNIAPNPVQNSTTISLTVLEEYNVDVSIYNVAGELVETIVPNKTFDRGHYMFDLDMSSYATGIYICNVYLNGEITSKKIIKTTH